MRAAVGCHGNSHTRVHDLHAPDTYNASIYAAGYRQEALKIKQEYHHFRSKIAQLMLLYASVLVFAMWHAASSAEKETKVHHGTFAAFNGVLRHSFSPIIMVSVQARPSAAAY